MSEYLSNDLSRDYVSKSDIFCKYFSIISIKFNIVRRNVSCVIVLAASVGLSYFLIILGALGALGFNTLILGIHFQVQLLLFQSPELMGFSCFRFH